MIPLVDRLSRKTHYLWTTWILAVLFACMAIAISQTYAQPTHRVTMAFYVLAQFMFNLGPNTLTFILAAEIFPTEVRGTSYGIAAAFGKIGALIVRGIIKLAGKGQIGLVVVLSVFCAVLVAMAGLISWEPMGITFPPVQKPRSLGWKESSLLERIFSSKLENKSLEDISPWPLAPSEAATTPGDDRETRSESESESEVRASREVQQGISLEEIGATGNTVLQIEHLEVKGHTESEIASNKPTI